MIRRIGYNVKANGGEWWASMMGSLLPGVRESALPGFFNPPPEALCT